MSTSFEAILVMIEEASVISVWTLFLKRRYSLRRRQLAHRWPCRFSGCLYATARDRQTGTKEDVRRSPRHLASAVLRVGMRGGAPGGWPLAVRGAVRPTLHTRPQLRVPVEGDGGRATR